jgi:manganese-dependent inorganic pyrophosphatase
VLDRFGFQPPKRITSMHTQVKDLEFDQPPVFSTAVTMGRAWKMLGQLTNINAIPVANEDGTLYGMLSRTDVADYNMSLVSTGRLNAVPLFNLLSVLEGKVLNEAGEPLPMTGGIGTKIFYMIGSVLIAGSAIILAARRRLAGF